MITAVDWEGITVGCSARWKQELGKAREMALIHSVFHSRTLLCFYSYSFKIQYACASLNNGF